MGPRVKVNLKLVNRPPETGATTVCRQPLGCWADTGTNRAILGGNRLAQYEAEYVTKIRDLIEDCHNFAQSKGWNVFGVQYGRECFTSADAENTYQKHGQTDRCFNGEGGFDAMDVYKIESCITTGC